MKDSPRLTRRGFIEKSAVAGTAVSAAAYFASENASGQEAATGPNDKIHVGIIGCGGMGRGNLGNTARHPDVVVTAAC